VARELERRGLLEILRDFACVDVPMVRTRSSFRILAPFERSSLFRSIQKVFGVMADSKK